MVDTTMGTSQIMTANQMKLYMSGQDKKKYSDRNCCVRFFKNLNDFIW